MIWIILGSVLLLLILAFLGFEYYVYKRVFYSPHKGQNDEFATFAHMKGIADLAGKATELVKELLKVPSEDLYVTSHDKLKLHAYFYKSEGSKDYVVYFHGFRRTARRSFAGRALDLLKAKKNVILVDERAHGLSKGHKMTYGKKEQYDVVTWVNYIQQKFGKDVNITIIGISMGATALLAAADKIDVKVKIIADSPYMSTKDVVKRVLAGKKLNPKVGYFFISLASIIYCHTSMKLNVVDNIHNSKNKILILYGTADSYVPYTVIEAVFFNNKDHVKLELFDGVGHGIAYNRATEQYRKAMFDFINN